MGFRKQTRNLIFLLCLATLLLSYTQKNKFFLLEKTSNILLQTVSFCQENFYHFFNSINKKVQQYHYFTWDFEENKRLKKKLEQTSFAYQLLKEAELENQRLKDLLQAIPPYPDMHPIYAPVIGRTGYPLSRLVQIGAGTAQGIQKGDGVITSKGVLGRVVITSLHYAQVLLLTDVSSAIDVVIQRTRSKGILTGLSHPKRYGCQIDNFDRLADVKIGDILITSGIGIGFPAGIPVGKITHVQKANNGLFIETQVEPFTKANQVEEVLVLRYDKNHLSHRAHVSQTLLGQTLFGAAP